MKQNKKKLIFIILTIFFIYFIFIQFKESYLLKEKERLNVIIYSAQPVFYSFFNHGPSYSLIFSPEVKVLVPGGYGIYRVGALGKLINLEKNPQLYKKIFSLQTASMVNLYFYPCGDKIYYQKDILKKINDLFAPIIYCSNGNFFDRGLIFYNLIKNKNKLIQLKAEISKDNFFNNEEFFKKNQGIFYKLRNKVADKSVQILYTRMYKSALFLSYIIEGEGIRVSDIDQLKFYLIRNPATQLKNKNFKKRCLVIENSKKPSVIAKTLMDFFDCYFFQEETEISDIILVLGGKEEEWEIQ